MGRMNTMQAVGARGPAGIGARGVFALLAAGLVLACQTAPDVRVATPEERSAYSDALSRLPQDPVAARQQLEAFLDRYPGSPLADDAGEKLAAIELGQGRRGEAERWLRWVLREHPDGDRAESARIALAGCSRASRRPTPIACSG